MYGLYDPLEPNELRYVGKTTIGQRRFYPYRNDKSRTHRGAWLRALHKAGRTFSAVVIEECSPDDLAVRERHWIAYYRRQGARLTNATDGGEGTLGRVVTPETRAKSAASNRGQRRKQETCARLSVSLKLRWQDEQYRSHMIAAKFGKKNRLGCSHSIETRARMSENLTRLRAAHPELTPRGEAAGGAKLTEQAVIAIRKAWAEGATQTSLARKHGVGVPQIHCIVRRKSWAHVP